MKDKVTSGENIFVLSSDFTTKLRSVKLGQLS
jgi:hypothetical protein